MNSKGQAALEYLMTYGWALIVIAIVVGVLVYIMSTAAGGATCTSGDTQLIIKDQSITGTSAQIKVQNAYGRSLTLGDGTCILGDGDLDTGATYTMALADASPIACGTAGDGGVIPGSGTNSVFTISGVLPAPGVSGAFSGSVDVIFTVAGGVAHTATVTCSGTA